MYLGAVLTARALYTLGIRGIEDGREISENVVCGAISRVLSAKSQWADILACAANPELTVVLSNTTEVGIVADAKLHPLDELNTFDKAMAWLERHLAEDLLGTTDLTVYDIARRVGYQSEEAFSRAEEAAGIKAPPVGKAFVSVRDADKPRVLDVARLLIERGFSLVATTGTSAYLGEQGIACQQINKVIEGRPHIVDLIKNGEIVYIVNTTEGKAAIADSFSIRREALQHRVTYSTTIPGARALIQAIDSRNHPRVWSLQELHKELQG